MQQCRSSLLCLWLAALAAAATVIFPGKGTFMFVIAMSLFTLARCRWGSAVMHLADRATFYGAEAEYGLATDIDDESFGLLDVESVVVLETFDLENQR